MDKEASFDETIMMQALKLAEQGRVTAPPNPWVGCIAVKEGRIIGQGFHRAPGEPHAEVNALRTCQDPTGSTFYVTLEPCSHYGRTPPCVDALILAKVKKVVIGIEDPDPRVNGRGVTLLRQAGIEVISGVCNDSIAASLEPYIHHRKTGRPFCIAKAAVSVDGRLAAHDGTSRWISGPEARADVHRLRAESQAVVIGSGTAIADRPRLDVRDTSPLPLKQPLRVLLDRTGKVDPQGDLFDPAIAPTLWITETMPEYVPEGIEVSAGDCSPLTLLDKLGQRGVIQVLIEGGGKVFSSFLQAGLIDRLVVYSGPRILGDAGLPFFKDLFIRTIEEAPRLELLDVARFGGTLRVDYNILR